MYGSVVVSATSGARVRVVVDVVVVGDVGVFAAFPRVVAAVVAVTVVVVAAAVAALRGEGRITW